MAMPLSDIKVIDYCQGLAGPNASMLMADQGAQVIKVEPPERSRPRPGGPDFSYFSFNRNKRSIELDISKPRGREVLERLLRWADVFVTNMRLSARGRRRISYEDLAAINPRLIYASLTAYGELGPDADVGGVDRVVQARAGDIESRYPPDVVPSDTRIFHFDMGASINIFCGVMVALHERARTGQGQQVDVSLLQTALALQAIQMTRIGGRDESAPIKPLGLQTLPFHRCKDGRYISVFGLVGEWESSCRCIGLDQLMGDPRFDTSEKREQHLEELKAIIARHFLSRPAAEWETMLKAEGLMASVVNKISEVFDDPQVIANRMITEFAQPGIGSIKTFSTPFNLSRTAHEWQVRHPVPEKGQHTSEVLKELGYGHSEIAGLEAEQAIG